MVHAPRPFSCMPQLISPTEAIRLALPVVDVRSPVEFRKGHLPGAHNLPLFNDLQRAEVGTLYRKKGRQEAIDLGMEMVGPKLHDMVKQARTIAPNSKLVMHWLRGGMRSSSVAWWLERAGIDIWLRFIDLMLAQLLGSSCKEDNTATF